MSNLNEMEIRQEIITTCLKMEEKGINQGTSGNVSHRYKEGLLITPSGVSYDLLKPKDIVFVPFSSKNDYQGEYPPSSELDFHYDILKEKSEINCVVHNHSNYATAMAICGLDIPSHHYMIAVAGGDKIPCAKYATFGTQELSKNILEVLKNYKACLIANHGVVVTSTSLKKALWIAVEVETLAKQYILAKQIGEPIILSKQEINKVLKKFESYGLKK